MPSIMKGKVKSLFWSEFFLCQELLSSFYCFLRACYKNFTRWLGLIWLNLEGVDYTYQTTIGRMDYCLAIEQNSHFKAHSTTNLLPKSYTKYSNGREWPKRLLYSILTIQINAPGSPYFPSTRSVLG